MYVGNTPEQMMQELGYRYFYGLRRTYDGEMFVAKVDQTKTGDAITINNPGDPENNFPTFEEGQDFFEGRDVFHTLVYENLNYEQFRWDDKNIYYYINAEGELIAKINETHTYDDTVSSNGVSISTSGESGNYFPPGYVLDGYAESDGQEY